MTDEELDDLDAQMEHLLDGISPWPWRQRLEQGIPIIYAEDEGHMIGFSVYEDVPGLDGSPFAGSNINIMRMSPELATKVQELIKLLREERKSK